MATDVISVPHGSKAVVYFADGSSRVVEPESEFGFSIPTNGMATISDAALEEAGEAPPPSAFADAMIAFWQGVKEAAQPTATPMQAGPHRDA
jgi:prepilin-type processing-associated H-X9-DG protein